MLPGFRFLFAAIVLSMSILVFGLGAAALLRTAHEEFASTPTWRAAPETVFAQPAEATRPVLALLRVDTPVTEKAADNAPANPAPAGITTAPAEPERVAALKPEDSPPPEAAKTETPVAESQVAETPVPEGPAQNETASTPADVPAAAAAVETRVADTGIAETKTPEARTAEIKTAETRTAETKTAETRTAETKTPEIKTAETKTADIKIAVSEDVALPANQAVVPKAAVPQTTSPVASEPMRTPVAPEANFAATRIATLGGPPVTIETPHPAKVESAKAAPDVIKKRQQARHAARRRRVAARARLAVQVPPQPADPFGQPAPTIVRRR